MNLVTLTFVLLAIYLIARKHHPQTLSIYDSEWTDHARRIAARPNFYN